MTLADELRREALEAKRQWAEDRKRAEEEARKSDHQKAEEHYKKVKELFEGQVRKSARRGSEDAVVQHGLDSPGSYGYHLRDLIAEWASTEGMHVHLDENKTNDLDYPDTWSIRVCWAEHKPSWR